MTSTRLSTLRRGLLTATATASATMLMGGVANAQSAADYGLDPVFSHQIVTHHEVTPGPGNPASGANYANSPQVLDPAGSINGIGQQIVLSQSSSTGAGLGLCTGTLINPRTVITAAHCVYSRPAHMYGSETGSGGGVYGAIADLYGATQGVPISFGFGSTNRCLGVAANGCAPGEGGYEAWRDSNFSTNVDKHIYNGNQVWYPGISTTEFANADIALVTLDTHAKNIPTWTLLFSPLDGPTHATIHGYGGTGVGLSGIGSLAGIDYRRRSAENMIDALMTYRDWAIQPAIYGPGHTGHTEYGHNIYWLDFDDPSWDPNNLPDNFFTNTAAPGARNNGYYDFNVFGGPSGTALPFEGATAGGDSGGPLVVDQRWDRKVIAGVLTGSISFNGGISTYGQMNVYPPLFLFWEDIVQNNPYVYASAKAGSRSWFDPNHWVQDMDPNYAIIGSGGQLLNGVPNTNQGGSDGQVGKFGTVCFVNQSCSNLAGQGSNPTSNGPAVVTAGGPGSTKFVPNNVEPVNSANSANHVKARYYDVTLREAGTTTISNGTPVVIDNMTLAGANAKLLIGGGNSLSTWADYTQVAGWTNVNGTINTNEMLVVSGMLSGAGWVRADYLTVVGAYVSPGNNGLGAIGSLWVGGNAILASASNLMIELSATKGDRLEIRDGAIALSNGTLTLLPSGAAPKHNQSFTIINAPQGGVSGTFGTVNAYLGLLKPTLTYNANTVVATLKAQSIIGFFGASGVTASPTALAFAGALDQLRDTSYTQLDGLYSTIDLMDAASMARTLGGLAPNIATENRSLQSRQSTVMLNNITDRLATLGTGPTGTLSVNGSSAMLSAMATGYAPSGLGLQGMVPTGHAVRSLPQGMTGFVASGFTSGGSAIGENRAGMNGGQRSWYVGMGLEMEVMPELTIGTAFGYATGFAAPGGTDGRTESQMTQAAFYGSYQLGGGAYVAGVASAEMGRTTMQRYASTGMAAFDLFGATETQRFNLMAEAGVALEAGRGLTVTPRAQMGWSSYNMGGFRESGGVTALQLDDLNLQRLEGRVGARIAGTANIAGWTLEPHVTADMVSTLSGANAGMSVRFANAGNHAFMLPIAGGDRAWGEVRGGLKATSGRLSFGAGIESSIGRSDLRDDRAVADFTLRF